MDDRKAVYLDDALNALEKVAKLFPYGIPGNYDTYDRYNEAWDDAIGRAEIGIEELPPAQPEIIRCKDCKHWRDSDGVYRRGIDAESKCPLNTQEVYTGTFYCGYAERRDE